MLARRLATGVMALGVASLIYSGGPPPVWAIAEADRLWLVGEHAFADRLYAVSRRALERFVKSYPTEARVGEATLLLGKSQFGLREFQAALENFRKAQRLTPPPGRPEEARFWGAGTLFRLKRYPQAGAGSLPPVPRGLAGPPPGAVSHVLSGAHPRGAEEARRCDRPPRALRAPLPESRPGAGRPVPAGVEPAGCREILGGAPGPEGLRRRSSAPRAHRGRPPGHRRRPPQRGQEIRAGSGVPVPDRPG